jgi:NADH-quinone oxidoreductase subunit K
MCPLHYLVFTSTLFLLGLNGLFFNRKNVVVMLVAIECMLLAAMLNFLVFSTYSDDAVGMVFALCVLTVAASESVLGLSLLVTYYRTRGTIEVDFIHLLKG